MFPEIPWWLAVLFVGGGLWALAWSSNRFVDGASALATMLGVSPFVVGMVVIGFGTSAPELFVSVLSGVGDKSDLSLGNAYGSCIFNIAVILGVAALIRPIAVKPRGGIFAAVALAAISALSGALVAAGDGFSRRDGMLLLAAFIVLMPVYCWIDARKKKVVAEPPSIGGGMAALWLCVGLVVLVASSHLLVWGSVDIARALGVSELMIGLTIVAVGTSLPELASAVASARKGQHEFVLGNVVGSNFFNSLAVVGLAGSISPFRAISPYVLWRDIPAMVAASLLIGALGTRWGNLRAEGSIGRVAGLVLLVLFVAYMALVLCQETALR